jgi:TonB family protein
MGAASSQKILRVGVLQEGRIVEERLIRRAQSVTVGTSGRNTFVVPASGLPPSHGIFEHKAGGYALVFTEQMAGRVRLEGKDLTLAQLCTEDLAQPRGQVWVCPLPEDARGTVQVGAVTLLFQFVPMPAELLDADLPPLVKGSFIASMDRFFLAVLAASLLLHFSGATWVLLQPTPEEPELTLEELPDRFARVLVPQKIEEPKPVEVAQATEEEKPEDSKKDEGASKAEKTPAAAQNRAELEKKVASKGLLKILGSAGPGGALQDVLGGGTGTGDIAAALAGAGGIGLATADNLGAGGPRGGGVGEAASIGELGTSGGGKVALGAKKDTAISGRVREAAPEVDSRQVDRDALARYVRARINAIQSCYEKELRRNPSLKGRVVVRFTITTSGRASEVEIEENGVGNEAVASCIRTYIRGWVFPFKPDDDVSVAYPFVFSPAS